jgi:hypothetical protein
MAESRWQMANEKGNGMELTKAQQQRFWREWGAAKREQGWLPENGWSAEQIENERYALLRRAGFESLTEVDRLAGFDRLLAELAALSRPADLEAQMREQEMPRRRLEYAINKLAKGISPGQLSGGVNPYLGAILSDRFGHCDLGRLSLEELEQVRNTLAARGSARRRREMVEEPF